MSKDKRLMSTLKGRSTSGGQLGTGAWWEGSGEGREGVKEMDGQGLSCGGLLLVWTSYQEHTIF